MRKFKVVKDKYLQLNVKENNIDYAIDAIKYGTAKHIIIGDLIAGYRGMDLTEATNMMNDLYVAYGGEHKKENRRGYIYGAIFFLVSIITTFYICNENNVSLKVYIIDGTCFILGIMSIILSVSGNFREEKINRYSASQDK